MGVRLRYMYIQMYVYSVFPLKIIVSASIYCGDILMHILKWYIYIYIYIYVMAQCHMLLPRLTFFVTLDIIFHLFPKGLLYTSALLCPLVSFDLAS